jgi:hypothetical protein
LHGATIPFSYSKAGIYDLVSHEKLFNNREGILVVFSAIMEWRAEIIFSSSIALVLEFGRKSCGGPILLLLLLGKLWCSWEWILGKGSH